MSPSLPLCVLMSITLAACTQKTQPQRGAVFYAKYCTSCHGTAAQGDGPLAAKFTPPPPNLTLLSKRNGGVFPTEGVMAQVNGYQGRHQFGGMPEFEQDLGGPVVDYVAASGEILETPQTLIDVARYLESIQQD